MEKIHMIVACAANRVIGRKGRLPWKIREDWAYFTDQTRDGILILGRVAFEEMLEVGAVRKDRRFIVLTRNSDWGKDLRKDNVYRAGSLAEGLEIAGGMDGQIWICGGQKIYEEGLSMTDRLYLTHIEAEIEGDTYFPEWRNIFTKIVSAKHREDENYRYTFYIYEKSA